jgi:hypothetical protein
MNESPRPPRPRKNQLEEMSKPALHDSAMRHQDQHLRYGFPYSEGRPDILKAYDTFGNAGRERALKVILTNQSEIIL